MMETPPSPPPAIRSGAENHTALLITASVNCKLCEEIAQTPCNANVGISEWTEIGRNGRRISGEWTEWAKSGRRGDIYGRRADKVDRKWTELRRRVDGEWAEWTENGRRLYGGL